MQAKSCMTDTIVMASPFTSVLITAIHYNVFNEFKKGMVQSIKVIKQPKSVNLCPPFFYEKNGDCILHFFIDQDQI